MLSLPPPPFTRLTSPPPTPMEPPRPGGEGGHVIRVTGTARNRGTVCCHSRCVRFPAPIVPPSCAAATRAAEIHGTSGESRRFRLSFFLLLPTIARRASALGARVSPSPSASASSSHVHPPLPPGFCICIPPRFCFPSLPLLAAPAAAGEERALPATTICRVAMRPRDLVYWEYGK